MVNIVYQVYSHLPRRCRPCGTCRNRWGSSRCPARTRPASTAASPSCSPLGTAASRARPDGPRVAKFEPQQKRFFISVSYFFGNLIKKLYFGSHETCMAVWSTGCLRKPWEITLPSVPCNENCHFQFAWSKKVGYRLRELIPATTASQDMGSRRQGPYLLTKPASSLSQFLVIHLEIVNYEYTGWPFRLCQTSCW